MNKAKELEYLHYLLSYLKDWELVSCSESPDFIIRDSRTHELIGVEVTEYYPTRVGKNGQASVLCGKSVVEREKNRLQLFEESELGHSRFVPHIDLDDFRSNCVAVKEGKLKQYQDNHPECGSFFLLIGLNFYDNVIFEDIVSIPSAFDRIFFCEEPGKIHEIATQ